VIRGLELDCEIVVKCTRVNGVYTADPEKDPNANKYDQITMEKALDDGLNIMDHSAMAMARENHMPIYVCDINDIHLRGTDKLEGTKVLVN
jgi:uridylate kinase